MTNFIIELENVHTSYGSIEALKGIDIEVKNGEIVCLIGNNGAGKSTTLMTISGILKPLSGDILFEGKSIKGVPPHRIVEMGISQVPEGRRIFPKLTVKRILIWEDFLGEEILSLPSKWYITYSLS